ncbi:NADH-quinone oxidoreductase subunit K [Nesterenkonia alkaliphila]|uniref:Uncharacterized protein n=1 Tax=Nesterenkonia alkaliphila TaxID=1463631 RepID=A0A7K1UML1_9MICC|nr:NADH-quinone oxidoreductase subunit K [Nesterenkonia alkaliphila]MVT27707.1 hypothetical protein [Nesterenkonia alkaliphila]GFZ87754.1 hypothetical protein GCM10011359_16330 [Nesterenkonia alkaliphila]
MLTGLDTITWYLMIAAAVTVFGMVRLLLVRDLLARLIALDVTGIGVLLTLVALAARSQAPDAVLQALVITGLVIAVAFTGLGAVLIRRIEGARDDDDAAVPDRAPDEQTPGADSEQDHGLSPHDQGGDPQ